MNPNQPNGTIFLFLLLLVQGCALTGDGKPEELERQHLTALEPDHCAWVAAIALGAELEGGGPAPVLRRGRDEFIIEARSRPGMAYRFRKGGGFANQARRLTLPPGGHPLTLNHLFSSLEPLPLANSAWQPRDKAPFPAFYEGRILVTITPGRGKKSLLAMETTEPEGDATGDAAWESLHRMLKLAEALALGNSRFKERDILGALVAYDFAIGYSGLTRTRAHQTLAAKIQINRGILLARMDRMEDSRSAFCHALSLDPDPSIAHPLAVLTAISSGQPNTARAILIRQQRPANAPWKSLYLLISKHLDSGLAYKQTDQLMRGQELLSRGRAQAASRCFRRARLKHPLAAARGLAQVERKLGKYREARDHLLYCLSLAPHDPALLAELSSVERDGNRPEMALHHAARLGPTAPFFRLTMRSLEAVEAASRLTLGEKSNCPLPLGTAGNLGKALIALRTGRFELLDQKQNEVLATPPR